MADHCGAKAQSAPVGRRCCSGAEVVPGLRRCGWPSVRTAPRCLVRAYRTAAGAGTGCRRSRRCRSAAGRASRASRARPRSRRVASRRPPPPAAVAQAEVDAVAELARLAEAVADVGEQAEQAARSVLAGRDHAHRRVDRALGHVVQRAAQAGRGARAVEEGVRPLQDVDAGRSPRAVRGRPTGRCCPAARRTGSLPFRWRSRAAWPPTGTLPTVAEGSFFGKSPR